MGGGSGGRIPSSSFDRLEEKAKKNLHESSSDDHHVFISFAHEDESEVDFLRGQAKNEKTQLSFDDYSLKKEIGSNEETYVKKKLSEKIAQASVTVVYLSPKAHKSDWVNWEIEKSIEKGKGVIGVHKSEKPPSQLPPAFKKHGCEVIKWSHKGLTAAINKAAKDRLK